MDLLSALSSFMPSANLPEDVFMALGDYRFSMSTAAYDTFKRDTKWRWGTQERLTRTPAKQYIGEGEDVITLDGVIYPHFRGGTGQINDIRKEANKKTPLLLVDGLGYVYGYWVITSLTETNSNLWERGVPLKQTFNLTLEFYGEDAGKTLTNNKEITTADTGTSEGLTGKIASAVESIKATYNETAAPYVEKVAETLVEVGKTVNDAVTVINDVQNKVATVMAAKQSIETMTKNVSNITKTLSNITQGNVITNISKLGGNLKDLQYSAAKTSKTVTNVNNIVPSTVKLLDNTMTNVQNAAYSAQSALTKLLKNG